MDDREKIKILLWAKVPEQLKEHFKTLRWYFYGARGSGRTHTAIVVALIAVLDGREGVVIDHTPYFYPMSEYVKTMIMEIANSVGMKVKIRVEGNSYKISLIEEDFKIT